MQTIMYYLLVVIYSPLHRLIVRLNCFVWVVVNLFCKLFV